MLTEAFTWVMTGIGMAPGSFAPGWFVDNFGAENGFWVATIAGVASTFTVALGQARLSRS